MISSPSIGSSAAAVPKYTLPLHLNRGLLGLLFRFKFSLTSIGSSFSRLGLVSRKPVMPAGVKENFSGWAIASSCSGSVVVAGRTVVNDERLL